MVEEFDGKKGDEKYEEEFSNSLLESFKMRGSFQLPSTTQAQAGQS